MALIHKRRNARPRTPFAQANFLKLVPGHTHLRARLRIIVRLLLAIAGVIVAGAHGADAPPQSIPVRGGIAQWRGVDFPIYPGVNEVTALGAGVSYRLAVANRKEGDALGSKIAAFYANKQIGTNAILSEIRKRTFRDYTSFANNVTTTTNRGAAVNINATINQVLVRLQPNSAPPMLAYPKGPFQADWNSLSNYCVPRWYRDAKFGIWAHWGPESVPEAGDWYGRNLYLQGHEQNKIHLQRYGHPSKFGFKDIIHLWKAENFNPEKLVNLYKSMGARYFVAQAVFHDNFDNWNSKYQPWNAVNMGPQRDIIGAWADAARKAGLPFGMSVHARSAYTLYVPCDEFDHKRHDCPA
ncbi:MAG: alpha-L-fucosidase, partial [Verrucomicrobiota bacterium]